MKRKNVLYQFRRQLSLMGFALVGSLGLQKADAQVTISQLSSYTQNFDALPPSGTASWADNATVPGWYAAAGTTASTAIVASTGTSATAGLKSYGSVSATERAIGCVNTSGTHYYGVRIKNNTGSAIKRFIISYTAEVWAKPSGNKNAAVKFYYQVGATSLTSGTWTEQTADQLTLSTGGGSAGALNGNLSANRLTATFSTQDINLAAGAEVMLRWADANTNGVYIALDDISITPNNTTVYYSKSTGNLAAVATWGLNADGSGTSPANFSNGTFIVANRSSASLSQNWVVTSPAKVLLGEGALTIPAAYTLTGTIDLASNTALTIENTVLPTLGIIADNSTVTYSSSGNITLASADYSNLSVSGTGTKRLGMDTHIKKSLSFSGSKLELGNFDLTIEPGASITGAGTTGYVVTNGSGSLVQEVADNNTSVIFPVGNSTYMPAVINQAANGTTDNFKVKALDGIYSNYINNQPNGQPFQQKAVNLTWIVDEELVGGSDITLTLQWDNAKSLSNFDPGQTLISHFHNGAWDETSPTNANALNGMYSMSRSGITSFSPFGVFSGSPSALPVELISFRADRSETGVNCLWATASEKNNSHFAIERSQDGKEFAVIGEVKGQGTTSQQANYSFTDLKPSVGTAYYRLRQVDFDGAFTFSPIVMVKGNAAKPASYTLYPNPGNGIQYIKQGSGGNELLQVNIRNLQGNLLQTTTASSLETLSGYKIDLSGQPKGLYLIELVSGTGSVVLKALNQ